MTNPISMNQLETISAGVHAEQAKYRGMLMVCNGTGCVAAKGFEIKKILNDKLAEHGLQDQWLVVGTGCNGFCAVGPIVVVQPEGIFYQKLKEKDVETLVTEHLVGGKPVEKLMHKNPVTGAINPKMEDISFFTKQQLVALRNKGLIDPENLDHYIARGGYTSLRRVLTENRPEDVIAEITRSGLRGRGGGGFPAGVKWASGRKAMEKRGCEIYVVCNADEGDPGAFMDRSIIESDPYAVIEGMTIGAFAVGASEGFIYIRKEYPLALVRLNKALEAARAAGLL
ncbi:NADH-quinone oxidoreductase subunit F, partial [Myxococcota bacterium]|nr:NADH-quinone oxidoreductase subunit F [Myxococcota bacterium]